MSFTIEGVKIVREDFMEDLEALAEKRGQTVKEMGEESAKEIIGFLSEAFSKYGSDAYVIDQFLAWICLYIADYVDEDNWDEQLRRRVEGAIKYISKGKR